MDKELKFRVGDGSELVVYGDLFKDVECEPFIGTLPSFIKDK